MKTLLKSATAAILASLCFMPSAFSGEAGEQPLQVSELPRPVQTTLQRDGGEVLAVERETEAGQSFYEATLSKDGKRYSLHIADDGKVLKKEGADRFESCEKGQEKTP